VRDFAFALRAKGISTDLQSAVIVTDAVTVKVIPACSAWVGMAAIIALILAFPGGSKKGKLYGVVLAVTLLYVVNIVRLASTISLTSWYGLWVFNLLHIFLWREAMIGIALVGWVGWLKWLAKMD
jgi:exosortase/archaeosortase family protein